MIDLEKYMINVLKYYGDPYFEVLGVTPSMCKNTKASAEFDKENGTKISKQYVLPNNLSSDKLWILISAADRYLPSGNELKRQLYMVYKNIVSRYPKLRGLNSDWEDVLCGVASEYNEDDIREYVVLGGTNNRSEEHRKRINNFQSITGKTLFFAPSTRTMDYLYKFFNIY